MKNIFVVLFLFLSSVLYGQQKEDNLFLLTGINYHYLKENCFGLELDVGYKINEGLDIVVSCDYSDGENNSFFYYSIGLNFYIKNIIMSSQIGSIIFDQIDQYGESNQFNEISLHQMVSFYSNEKSGVGIGIDCFLYYNRIKQTPEIIPGIFLSFTGEAAKMTLEMLGAASKGYSKAVNNSSDSFSDSEYVNIYGTFNGVKRNNIYHLSNGYTVKQISNEIEYSYLYSPKAKFIISSGKYYLYIIEEDILIEVSII